MGEPSSQPDLELKLFSQARLLAPTRALVGTFAQRLGFDETQCGQISLAIDEALCNIINHGYDRRPDGTICLRLWALADDPPGIRIVIEDEARQVDPGAIRSRDLDDIRPGGLGVYIIREIMDVVHYEKRNRGGMRLSMSKSVPPDHSETGAATSSSPGACKGESKHAGS